MSIGIAAECRGGQFRGLSGAVAVGSPDTDREPVTVPNDFSLSGKDEKLVTAHNDDVLVVHPDDTVRQCLGGILNRRGYRTVAALDENDAMAIMKAGHPAVVIVARDLPSGSYRSLLDAVAGPPPAIIFGAPPAGAREETTDPRVVAQLRPMWPLRDLYRAVETALSVPHPVTPP